MVTLSTTDKILVLAGGFGVVFLAILLVVCVVTPFCPLHRILPEQSRLRITPLVKRKRKKVPKSDANGTTELTQLTNGSTYINYGNDIHTVNNEGVQQQTEILNNKQVTPQRRPTVLSTRESTVDSTYSSMTPTGSRPSTPVSSKSDPQDLSSSMDSNSIRSADSSPLYGSVIVSLHLSYTEDPSTMRLIIGIQEAQDLPSRDNVTCGDPFFKIFITKETRTFRRSKSKGDILAEFETSIQKKTRHPIYNQKFAKEIPKSDLKDCIVRFAAFDKDKYANPTEFGETAVSLKNLNLPIHGQQPVLISLELSEPKQTNGEIQLGLMYLPTAERLAFSAFKVSNLRHDHLHGDPNISHNVYIRIIALHNNKMVNKKKTSSQKLSSLSCFDETVAFDVPTKEIRNISFVVVVVITPKESKNDNEISLDGLHERCIGKVILGPKARSTGLQHWELSLQRPREQIMLWHVLR